MQNDCQNSDSSCLHFPQILKLSQRLHIFHCEFEEFRSKAFKEKEFLEAKIRALLIENRNLKQDIFALEEKENLRSKTAEMQASQKHSNYLEQTLAEKNEELARLRQRISELMEHNRKLQLLVENESFEKENQKSDFLLKLKEKEIAMQRLKTDFERQTDFSDKERVNEKALKNQFKSEAHSLASQIEFLKSSLEAKEMEIIDWKRQAELLPKDQGISQKILDARLKQKISAHSDELLDLLENRSALSEKANCLKFWVSRFRAKVKERETVAQAFDGKFRQISVKMDKIIGTLRDEMAKIIYELFIGSIDSANSKKKNSFKAFIATMKKFEKENKVLLKAGLSTYFELNELCFSIDPAKKLIFNPSNLNTAKLDAVNKWIIESLVEILSRQNSSVKSQDDSNEVYLGLFRMLMLNFRAENPMKMIKVHLQDSVRQIFGHCLVEQTFKLLF